jgi:hypothetical protein
MQQERKNDQQGKYNDKKHTPHTHHTTRTHAPSDTFTHVHIHTCARAQEMNNTATPSKTHRQTKKKQTPQTDTHGLTDSNSRHTDTQTERHRETEKHREVTYTLEAVTPLLVKVRESSAVLDGVQTDLHVLQPTHQSTSLTVT